MIKITVQNVNPNKLHDELIAAGIHPIRLTNDLQSGEYIAANSWIELPGEADMNQVQQIIDNHDPTPYPQPETPEQRIAALEDENAFLALELATAQSRLDQAEQEQAELLLLLVSEGVI